MYIPEEIVREIIEYIPNIDLDLRQVSKDWKFQCENHILNHMKQAFSSDSTFEMQCENGKMLDELNVKKRTAQSYDIAFNLFGELDFKNNFFELKKTEHVKDEVVFDLKLKLPEIETKCIQLMCNILNNSNICFVEKIKKINVLFFEHIFNARNLDYYASHQDSNMFDVKFQFFCDNRKTFGIVFIDYDKKDGDKKEKIENIKKRIHMEGNNRISIFHRRVDLGDFKPAYAIEFQHSKLMFLNNFIPPLVNKQETENSHTHEPSYNNYNDFISKSEGHINESIDKNSNECLKNLTRVFQVSLNYSKINHHALFKNQLNMIKHMKCINQSYYKKYETLIQSLCTIETKL